MVHAAGVSRFVFVLLLLALLPTLALAQDHPNREKGFKPEQAYQLNDLDSVNLFNGNLTATIPLGPRFQVGGDLSYGFTLVYSGNVWESDIVSLLSDGTPVYRSRPNRRDDVALGWRLGFGKLYSPNHPDNRAGWCWVYVGPDGSEHQFADDLHGSGSCDYASRQSGYGYTTDGTYLRLDRQAYQVEFPNGTVHSFGSDGRLRAMTDAFGNQVTFSYGASSWTVSDSHGRTHVVHLAPAPHLGQAVSSIEIMKPGGGRATYSIGRVDRKVSLPRDHTEVPSDGTWDDTVPLLETVALPDSSEFVISTYRGDQVNRDPVSGHLESLTLPTGGKTRWTYGTWQFPTDSDEVDGPAGLDLPLTTSTGVTTRQTLDWNSTVLGTWTYGHRLEPGIIGTGPNPDPPRESITTVTDPLGHETESFFSAYVSGPSAGGWSREEYGLPFTREVSDGAGRYLSTRVTDSEARLLRSSYVRYESSTSGKNQRLASTRTTFHDDGDRWTSVDHSDFDGFGHYRRTTTGGNFNQANTRTTYRNWNPNRGTWPGSWTNVATTSDWIVDTWSYETVTEGGNETARRDACFDADGFQTRERVWKVSGSRDADDLVRIFTRDFRGNLTRERRFGADTQAVSTATDLCTLPLPSPPAYWIDHTVQVGVRATSRVVRPNGTAMEFLSLDRTIDFSTGLVTTSRDPALHATTTEYDALGRPVWVRPQEGAWTHYDWQPNQRPARVEIFQVPNGATSTTGALTEEELRFDGLGRVIEERRRMPDGTWSVRRTGYDGSGNVASKTTWGTNPTASTRWRDYDPFGRPGEVVTPDGHTITTWYAGIRDKTTLVPTATSRGGTEQVFWSETYDRQGRLWRVTEPAVEGVRRETKYLYDVGGRLREVAMGGVGQAPTPPGPPPLIFEDGFESGGVSCWESVEGLVTSPARPCTTGSLIGSAGAPVPEAGASTITQTREFSYDLLGNLRSESHPELAGVVLTYGDYDVLGNPGRTTNGVTTLLHAYDPAGRPLSITEPGGQLWKEWTYGNGTGPANRSRGKVVSAIRHNWVIPPWELGNPTAALLDIAVTETYTYGGLAGRMSTVDTHLVTGQAFRYRVSWDALGNLASETYPECLPSHTNCVTAPQLAAPGRTVTYGYGRGRLTAVNGWADLTYHPNGTVATVDHDNGVTDTISQDPHGLPRPGSISTAGATIIGSTMPRNWSSGSYSWDGAGNITEIGPDWYVYDPLSRLVESRQHEEPWQGGKVWWQGFTFDSFGNRLTRETKNVTGNEHQIGAVSGTTIAPGVVSATNRLSGAAYDGAGNVTAWGGMAYQWDPFNMMTALQGPSSGKVHIYGPGDERLWDFAYTDPEDAATYVETYTVRGLDGKVRRRYQTIGGNDPANWRYLSDHLYRDGQALAMALRGGAERHYTLDHLGSPRLVTNQVGYVLGQLGYQPFGDALVDDGALQEPLRFTGHERDDLGAGVVDDLDYMHARFYSPHLGRFHSLDPLGGFPRTPQSWNLYGYVVGNPMRFTDPRGLAPIECEGLECTDSITVTDEYDPLFGSWAAYIGSDGSAFGMYSWNPVIPEPAPVLSDSHRCRDLIPEPRPADVDLAANIDEARGHRYNLLWLASRVRTDAKWDFKRDDPAYQDFGNFHYGVVFSAAGISPAVSMVGAGVYQVRSGTSRPEWIMPYGFDSSPAAPLAKPFVSFPFGDDPRDAIQILRGIEYFERCVQ